MATQQLGTNAKLAWCEEETAYGVTEATPVFEQLNIISESIRMSRNLISSTTLTGSREPSQPELGNKDVAGDVAMEMQANGMDEMFRGLLGKATTTSGATFSHEIVIGDSLPSYTFEKSYLDLDTDEYFLYNGVKVASCSIGIKPEGFQDISFTFAGANETVAETTADDSGDYTVVAKEVFTGFDITLIEENGADVDCDVLSADISIENNLDAGMYTICTGANAGVKQSLPEGMVKISGNMSILFTEVATYNRAVAGTPSSLQVTYLAGTDSIDILIPELILSPQAPVIEGPTGLKVDFPFEAYYTTGTSAIVVTIVNDINRAYADA